jgi:hypothetical protein
MNGVRYVLTPMRARDENAISIVTDNVNHILEGISCSCCKNNMFWLYSVDWVEVGVEERGQCAAQLKISAIERCVW